MIKNIQEAKELLKDAEALKNDEPHDIISEIADNNIDIYYFDLVEWTHDRDNIATIEEAVNEFGLPKKFDFYKQIQLGQYKANETLLWEAWEELKLAQ